MRLRSRIGALFRDSVSGEVDVDAVCDDVCGTEDLDDGFRFCFFGMGLIGGSDLEERDWDWRVGLRVEDDDEEEERGVIEALRCF